MEDIFGGIISAKVQKAGTIMRSLRLELDPELDQRVL